MAVKKTKEITNEQLYEGLICIDIKLGKLLDIMDKMASYVDSKRKGEL